MHFGWTPLGARQRAEGLPKTIVCGWPSGVTEAGWLIRFGYGVHGRAEMSSITQQPLLAGGGFGPVAGAGQSVWPHPPLQHDGGDVCAGASRAILMGAS